MAANSPPVFKKCFAIVITKKTKKNSGRALRANNNLTFVFFSTPPQNSKQQQSDHVTVGIVFRSVPFAQHPFVREPVPLRLQTRMAVPAVAAQNPQAGIVHPVSRAGQHGGSTTGRHAQTSHAMR